MKCRPHELRSISFANVLNNNKLNNYVGSVSVFIDWNMRLPCNCHAGGGLSDRRSQLPLPAVLSRSGAATAVLTHSILSHLSARNNIHMFRFRRNGSWLIAHPVEMSRVSVQSESNDKMLCMNIFGSRDSLVSRLVTNQILSLAIFMVHFVNNGNATTRIVDDEV